MFQMVSFVSSFVFVSLSLVQIAIANERMGDSGKHRQRDDNDEGDRDIGEEE